MAYQNVYYNLENPSDTSLAAGKPYRELLTSQFDLVFVENHCFLEAFYVIIDDLPDKITIPQARELYIDMAHGVIVHKFKKRGQETQQSCHLVYDFKHNKE